MTLRRRKQGGYVLAFALIAVLVLTGGASALMMRSATENGAATLYSTSEQALQLAEAGLDVEVRNLSTISALDDVYSGALPAGTYQIASPVAVLSPLVYRTETVGTARGIQRRIEAVLSVNPMSIFRFAMFGEKGVTLGGDARTDSYDSRNGLYSPATAHANGNVGTNSTQDGAIDLNGDSLYVAGQLSIGPNVSDPSALVAGFNSALISGNPPVVSRAEFPLPEVTIPSGLTCSAFSLQGSVTYTLSAGTYCFSALSVKGGATLTSSGPVTIYLQQQLDFSGNSTIGVPTNPSQFLFLVASGSSVEIESEVTGNSTLYGAMYGPDAEFKVGGDAEIFGSIVGHDITMSGSAQLHYDEALADWDKLSNEGKVTLLSWREE